LKIAFVSGNFNVLHPGHLRLLRFAKEVSERLIVGVRSDRCAGKDSYIPENLRLEGIQSNGWVDEAFLLDEPIEEILKKIKPDIVVKGKEHEKGLNPEAAVLEEYGGKLLFSSGEVTFSSLDLIQRHVREVEHNSIEFPTEFASRHDVSRERLLNILDEIDGTRLVVVGDLIVDEYVTCEPLGMSQEDPSIVVTPIDSQKFLGGAGIVAAHASGLGAKVQFFSVAGDDSIGGFAIAELEKSGIVPSVYIDPARPTTLKQRFRANEKTLLRVSHLHQSSIGSELQQFFRDEISQILPDTDVLIFSDFNYGCLPQDLVTSLIERAAQNHVYMAADSQSSSQLGDVARFHGMHLLTPTEREARLSLRNQEDGLIVLGEELSTQANAEHLFLKLGAEGMILHVREKNGKKRTDRIPALNPHPRDVAGAGDSLLVLSILAIAAGANAWEAACLGSLAAAIQVSRIGNTPLRLEELQREFSV
jgi:rfaE bifunctional protein kinase chain/domain